MLACTSTWAYATQILLAIVDCGYEYHIVFAGANRATVGQNLVILLTDKQCIQED